MQLVISEIPDSAAQALLAVKLFAQYKSGQKSKVQSCTHQVSDNHVCFQLTACC